MDSSVQGALVSSGGGILSSTINAITNSINNKRNIEAQKEINATNIKAAKEQIEQQRQYALEDRDYNSTEAQYARYLAIGLSPAAARAAVNGGSSNLGSIDTSLPVQDAAMTTASDWSGIGTGAASAGQIISQAGLQEKQISHDEKMQDLNRKMEEEHFQREMINENYTREERDEASPRVSSFWKDLNIEAQNANFNLQDASREDVVNWLMSENTALLDQYNTLIGNACADAMLDVKFSQLQNSNKQALENQALISSMALQRAETSLRELSEEQIRQELKYYPALMNAEIQLKQQQSLLTSEEYNELVTSNAFQTATLQDRIKMLGLDVDIEELERDIRRFDKGQYHTDKNFQRVGMVVGALSDVVGMGTGVAGSIGMWRMGKGRLGTDAQRSSKYNDLRNKVDRDNAL